MIKVPNITPIQKNKKTLLYKEKYWKFNLKLQKRLYTSCNKAYFKQSLVKVELAIAKGKQLYDKRRAIQEKEQKRSIDRMLKAQKYR